MGWDDYEYEYSQDLQLDRAISMDGGPKLTRGFSF